MALTLRKTLLISLDDLLAVVREFLNPNASRSGMDRCLRRHGVGNLRALKVKEAKPKHSAFKAYEPGYLHIDVNYLPYLLGSTLRKRLPAYPIDALPRQLKFYRQLRDRKNGAYSKHYVLTVRALEKFARRKN